MTLSLTQVLARLGVAVLCGALIGLERESASRGAGARTLALVALGSAMFTLAGAYGFADTRPDISDPSRVAAHVAAGVGFIGAGAIIRNGTSVLGVTTASAVWLSAAAGVLAAAGGFTAAIVSTFGSLAVLIGLRSIRPLAWRIGKCRSIVHVEYERGYGTLGPLLAALDHAHGRLEHLVLQDEAESRSVTLHVAVPRRESMVEIMDAVKDRPEVLRMSTAEPERD